VSPALAGWSTSESRNRRHAEQLVHGIEITGEVVARELPFVDTDDRGQLAALRSAQLRGIPNPIDERNEQAQRTLCREPLGTEGTRGVDDATSARRSIAPSEPHETRPKA
jgi:hypothetical protein